MLCRLPLFVRRHNKVSLKSYIRRGAELIESTVGDYTYINTHTGITQTIIGRYCSIGGFVQIGGMEHDMSRVSTSIILGNADAVIAQTYIGNDVWIGNQAFIKKGVKIGNGAVIGAQAFVNKDVPPYAIVVGTPAKILRYRFPEKMINQIEESKYWEYEPEKEIKIIDEIESKY